MSVQIELYDPHGADPLRHPGESWEGITDPAKRRKLQNRIHQRAWRRRKAAERKQQKELERVAASDSEDREKHDAVRAWARSEPKVSDDEDGVEELRRVKPPEYRDYIPGSKEDQSFITKLAVQNSHHRWRKCGLNKMQLAQVMQEFEVQMRRQFTLYTPRTELLPSVVKYNVYKAMSEMNDCIGFGSEWRTCDGISPFYRDPSGYRSLPAPPHLQPTQLQRTIEHHPWLDLLPLPAMRDNILVLGEEYDDNELCYDMIEDTTDGKTGLIVWGNPLDLRNWEVGEDFVKKWFWVIRSCRELFVSTNAWRERRGEPRLFPEEMCRL